MFTAPAGENRVVVNYTPPSATDNSVRTVTTDSTHDPGDMFPLGDTTVTYQFRDESGNINQCQFVIVVSAGEIFIPFFFLCVEIYHYKIIVGVEGFPVIQHKLMHGP